MASDKVSLGTLRKIAEIVREETDPEWGPVRADAILAAAEVLEKVSEAWQCYEVTHYEQCDRMQYNKPCDCEWSTLEDQIGRITP